jgi:hypothetical protein
MITLDAQLFCAAFSASYIRLQPSLLAQIAPSPLALKRARAKRSMLIIEPP